MYSVSKTEPQKHVYQNDTQNGAKGLTSKNELFNHSSFGKSEIINWLVTLKTSLEVVSDPDLESQLVLHTKWDNFN